MTGRGVDRTDVFGIRGALEAGIATAVKDHSKTAGNGGFGLGLVPAGKAKSDLTKCLEGITSTDGINSALEGFIREIHARLLTHGSIMADIHQAVADPAEFYNLCIAKTKVYLRSRPRLAVLAAP